MYSLEDVLSWEAEMSDSLGKDREKLLMYRFIQRDLKLRRQVSLLEEDENPVALQQLDDTIGRVQEAINELEQSMAFKAGAVEQMYHQWTKLLSQKLVSDTIDRSG
ncbi:hypothetical protein PP175_05055 [Aneurinibacillus sp. Ricciae_BoGa-3]|uniref:hypothetical protein n=1 Tax=Aneurinibacillus sp. Ricciae_BoGa-3 TaxID=3022697 RepID=UPI002341EBB9|nr:hypothetical protein [Aneurinibacillus sp. Ricciae_BoGa-3]WCK55346.1 hypothetical protein PP175_05055 [Aneurinibacillus sp. Ricciae_BoGa-3]